MGESILFNLTEIQQGRILLLDWTTAARRTQRKLLLLFQEGMQVEGPIHYLLWKQELLPGSGRCNDSGYKRWVCCCLIGFYYAVIQQFTNRSKKSILSSFLVSVGLSDCPGVPGTFGGPTGEIWGRKDQSEPEFWWKTCHSPTLLDTVELSVSFYFFLFLSFSSFSLLFFSFFLSFLI